MENTRFLTYYEVLNLPPGAKREEIQEAWRRLCVKYHPDKGGDEEKFKQVTEAGAVLKEERKRIAYDKRLRLELDACPRCEGSGLQFLFPTSGAVLQGVRLCKPCKGRGFFPKKGRTK